MRKEKLIFDIKDIFRIAKKILPLLDKITIFTFSGPIGAGKTTLIRAILSELGVTDPVTSPTFTYINSYKNNKGSKFYHLDLYRINNIDDIYKLGLEEYIFTKDGYSFIEWPEIILPILKDRSCNIKIDYLDKDKRIIRIGSGGWI